MKGPRNTSSQKLSADPYSVNLLPDKSTDRLRHLANQAYGQGAKGSAGADTVPVRDKKPNNKVVRMDIYSEKEGESSDSRSQSKLASGFTRSERSQKLLEESHSGLQEQVIKSDKQKNELVQRLNESLLELDKLNGEKRALHEKLIEQTKFVRDLNRETNGASVEDLNSLMKDESRSVLQKSKTENKQLQELVSQAQHDRQELQSQLKKFTSGKEHIVLSQRGQTHTMQATNENLQRVVLEIEKLRHDVSVVEGEICQLRHLDQSESDPELLSKERAVAVVLNEKEILERKVAAMIVKEEQTVASLCNQHDKMLWSDTRNVKFLAVKSLSNQIVRATGRSYLIAFRMVQEMNSDLKCDGGQTFALKKLFKEFARRFCFEAYQRWFDRTFEPKVTEVQNRDLPDFYQRKGKEHLVANKLNIRMDRQHIDRLRFGNLGRSIVYVTSKWESRVKFSVIRHWQQKIYPATRALKFFTKKLNLNILVIKRKFFGVWSRYNSNCDENLRLSALPVKFSLKQLEYRTFKAWQKYSLDRCLRQRSRQLRAFKNLKIARWRSKYRSQMLALGDMKGRELEKSITQNSFSILAMVTEKAFIAKCEEQLMTIKPDIENLRVDLTRLSEEKLCKEKTRAVKAFIISLLSRRLVQFLMLWRRNTVMSRVQYQQNVKSLLLKLYKLKLRVGLDRLRYCTADKQSKRHLLKIEGIYENIVRSTGLNYKLGSEIGNERRRIQNLAFKHLRRLCEQAFERNLTYWLEKWQIGCHLKRCRSASMEFFITLLRKKILRQAMDRYERGCFFLRQDEYNTKRIDEVKKRLATRQKQRVYTAIRKFAIEHASRTKRLGLAIKMVNRAMMVRGMLTWQRYSKSSREHDLLLREKAVVEQIDETQEDLSLRSDQLNDVDLESRRLRKDQRLEVSLTLQKWLERFAMGSQRYGFSQWRLQTLRLRHRAQVVADLFLDHKNHMYRTAFLRWNLATDEFRIEKNKVKIKHELYTINQEKIKQSFELKVHKKTVETVSKEFVPVQEQHRIMDRNRELIMQKIIKWQGTFDSAYFKRYVLRKWLEHNRRYRKYGIAVERGLTKMILQRGFDAIRDTNRLQDWFAQRQKFAQRVGKLYGSNRSRNYFNRWRDHAYIEEVNQKLKLRLTTHKEISDQNNLVKRFKAFHCAQMNKRKYERTLREMWDSWHEWAFVKAIQKRETGELSQRLDHYRAKRTLTKWQQRVEATHTMAGHRRRVADMRRRIYQRACFYKIKHQYQCDMRMIHSTDALVKALKSLFQQYGFKSIKYHSQIRYHGKCRDKEQGSRAMVKILDRLLTGRYRFGTAQLKNHKACGERLQAILKQYVLIGRGGVLRDYFNKWHEFAEKESVVEHHEIGEGPTNLLCWKLRLRNHALAEMVSQDGQPDHNIQLLIKRARDRSTYLGDKTITRLLVADDRNLRLMPYYFDRLRAHAQTMRFWKRASKFAQLLQGPRNGVLKRFRQWKEYCWKYDETLYGTPYEELVKREDGNIQKLQWMADDVDVHNEAIRKFHEQIGTLEATRISAISLGFSLKRHNDERQKRKYVNRLSDYGNKTLKHQISLQISNNLLSINQLKDRIGNLELTNEKLARNNDEYRVDALQAERNLVNIQQLRTENGHLLGQQSEHASAVKKLMQENYLMTRHLQHARNETKENLDRQVQLYQQKMSELDQLKQAEKESDQRKERLSMQSSLMGGHCALANTQRMAELSPPAIVSPTSSRWNQRTGKSPLRVRNLSSGQKQAQT